MSIEIKVPLLPESVADATLVIWHKAPGETVERDENIADLETDKVVLEVPAPARGILGNYLVQVGATVVSGQLLVVLSTAASKQVGLVASEAAGAQAAAALGGAQSPLQNAPGSLGINTEKAQTKGR